MGLMTEQQADACVINRCESFKKDGVHQYWVIAVLDEDGNLYELEDDTCAVDATDVDLKACMRAVLLTTEKKPAPPVISSDTNEGILGDTIG